MQGPVFLLNAPFPIDMHEDHMRPLPTKIILKIPPNMGAAKDGRIHVRGKGNGQTPKSQAMLRNTRRTETPVLDQCDIRIVLQDAKFPQYGSTIHHRQPPKTERKRNSPWPGSAKKVEKLPEIAPYRRRIRGQGGRHFCLAPDFSFRPDKLKSRMELPPK